MLKRLAMQVTDKQCTLFAQFANYRVFIVYWNEAGGGGRGVNGGEQRKYFFFPLLTSKDNFSPLENGHNFLPF